MKKYIALSVTSLFLLLTGVVQATSTVPSVEQRLQAFRQLKDVSSIGVVVPTVVEVPIEERLERPEFAVTDMLTDQVQPYYYLQESRVNEISVSVAATNTDTPASNMIDGSYTTYTEFPLTQRGVDSTTIVIGAQTPITSSQITLALADHVAPPLTIEIRAIVGGRESIVLAATKPGSLTIPFPRTTASQWHIVLTYAQPLRVTNLDLYQENASVSQRQAVRFLAQPQRSYTLYFDADRYVGISAGESGDLRSNVDVKKLSSYPSQKNPLYVIADIDGDGVPDVTDNCVSVNNVDQADIDGNGRGDLCDDFDKDGIITTKDNCPDFPNMAQTDTDGDGIGDTCDTEESRLTEKYPLLPWVGIGFAGMVLVGLFAFAAVGTLKKKEGVPGDPTRN